MVKSETGLPNRQHFITKALPITCSLEGTLLPLLCFLAKTAGWGINRVKKFYTAFSFLRATH